MINKPLIRKMIKRIETMPETYEQGTYCQTVDEDDPRPVPVCRTVACLAGEAVIVSRPTVKQGVAALRRIDAGAWQNDLPVAAPVARAAMKLLRINDNQAKTLFWNDPVRWPAPFAARFESCETYKAKAKVAVDLLKAILKTNGKILDA